MAHITIDIHTEQLAVALFISTMVHLLVIYGVGFVMPNSKRPLNTTLDIILVQKKTNTLPQQADYLAQATQEGGGRGESDSKDRPSTPTMAPFPSQTAEIAVTPPPSQIAAAPEPEIEPEIEPLTTESDSNDHVEPPPLDSLESPEEAPAEDTGDAEQTSELEDFPTISNIILNARTEVASIQAELNEKLQDYTKQKRHKHINASTKEYIYAGYMDAWRKKVEPDANEKYKAIHKRIEGSLVLDVAINRDGTIYDVELIKSSGYPVLDDVALRSIHSAAPFVPLPENIRKEVDVLHIIRTWEFSYNKVSTKNYNGREIRNKKIPKH